MTEEETSSWVASSVWETSKSVRHFRRVAPGSSLSVISPAIFSASSRRGPRGMLHPLSRPTQKRIDSDLSARTHRRSGNTCRNQYGAVGPSIRGMPSTVVHLALAGLIAAGLLGRAFSARSLAVALAAVVLVD